LGALPTHDLPARRGDVLPPLRSWLGGRGAGGGRTRGDHVRARRRCLRHRCAIRPTRNRTAPDIWVAEGETMKTTTRLLLQVVLFGVACLLLAAAAAATSGPLATSATKLTLKPALGPPTTQTKV